MHYIINWPELNICNTLMFFRLKICYNATLIYVAVKNVGDYLCYNHKYFYFFDNVQSTVTLNILKITNLRN